MLRQLDRELQASRTELADIAGGQLPAALREGGLAGGLAASAATARRNGLQVDLHVDISGLPPTDRLPDEVASAVYYCCSEALQNVAKYAGASRVSVEVTAVDGQLVFAVADDGRGFDPTRGSDGEGGLRGLDDRASLHGGWIAVDATPGGGTRVRGAIPLSGPHPETTRGAT
jgi:signal transduction histidine kinase